MNELRWNPLAGQWVTIATERAARPSDFAPRFLPVEAEPGRPCPFCPGNEDDFPPALESYARDGDWRVRVVPNKYPAFRGVEPLDLTRLGPVFTQAPASGIHEVLVLSPDHHLAWADLDDRQVALVMAAVRDRVEEHGRHAVVQHSLVIVNHGREAGASLEHPHGQLLGTPFVSRVVADEATAFADFDGRLPPVHRRRTRSGGEGHRLVDDGGEAVVLSPYWAGSPYELLVLPTAHGGDVDGVGPGRRRRRRPSRPGRAPPHPVTAGRRAVQPHPAHRPARPRRPVPLARPRHPPGDQRGRLRAGHRRPHQHRRPRAGRPAAPPPGRRHRPGANGG